MINTASVQDRRTDDRCAAHHATDEFLAAPPSVIVWSMRNLADLYDLPALDWQVIVDRLDAGLTQAPGTGGPDRHTCWLATIDADGRPHVTGIGAMWHNGAFWFETGKTTARAAISLVTPAAR